MPLGTGYFGEGYFGGDFYIPPAPPPPAPGLPASYTTSVIYTAAPQFVQDQDAENGYALYLYLYGVCAVLDGINNLIFDDVGAGVTVQPTANAPQPITLAKLGSPIAVTDYYIYVFGTDSSWEQIDTTENFVVQIELEQLLITGGSYDWTAKSLTLPVSERGHSGTTVVAHDASSGTNGNFDLKNYAGAPGWSQAIDIERCPSYALPWLGQFVGAGISQNSGLTYRQTIEKISERSGFQRSTAAAIKAEMVAVINAQTAGAVTPLLTQQVILLENTCVLASRGANLFTALLDGVTTTIVLTNTDSSWGTIGSNSSFVLQINEEKILVPRGSYDWMSGPVTLTGVTRGYDSTTGVSHPSDYAVSLAGGQYIYGYDEYAMVILIPAGHYNLYTYASLVAAAGGDGTYTAVEDFITTLGGLYSDLTGSPLPVSSSNFVNFIYRYRPAGIQVFVGGY